MKKRGKMAAVIILTLLIIAGIIISIPFLSFFFDNRKQLVESDLEITEIIQEIRYNIGFRDYYKNKKKDIISFYYRATDKTDVIIDDSQILLSNEGYLVSPAKKVSQKDIEINCSKIKAFQDFSNQCGAKFLYVYAPGKAQFTAYPKDIENYASYNYELFIDNLRKLNIETLDLANEMEKENKGLNDICFITDGHWKPEAGFWANGKICQCLREKCGFNYNSSYTDIKNYEIKHYDNWFLGSMGKSVGKNFSPLGVDDFSLITPKFDTDITETRPFENETKRGDFLNTVIDNSKLKYKNLYLYNTYASYSGGDYRLQITTNNNAENDDIILIVRTSFACVVTPFLTLNCKELHTVDIRNFEYLGAERIDLSSYIKAIQPDYVIVLYNSVAPQDTAGLFDFLN